MSGDESTHEGYGVTDVLDREPQVDVARSVEPNVAPPPRRSRVARALTPILRRSAHNALALIPSVESRPDVLVDIAPKSRFRGLIALSLIVTVLAPTVASGLYLFGIASDQYVAETRFAVRKAEPSHMEGFSDNDTARGNKGQAVSSSSLLSGTASLAGEDAEIIANYIHSRAAVDDVSAMLDLKSIYRRPEADFWARLPADATAEALTEYWKRMVSVYVEPTSGIVTVSASAFRREDALAVTRAVLSAGERLANSLTLKMRADQTSLAEGEVRRSEANVRFALADLTAFRDAQHLIDPVETSKSTGTLLMQLMSDRIQTEGQLFVSQRMQGPNAPGIAATKARLESVNKHIAELQEQLAGTKDAAGNMAATMARFAELELKRDFAEKMFEFARKGLERAELTAMAQSTYLAVFMPPALPQDFTYPNRFTDLFLIALAAMMTWMSGATITASVLDHRL